MENLKETLIEKFKKTKLPKKISSTAEDAIEFTIDELKKVPVSTREFLIEFKNKNPNIFKNFNADIFINIVRHLRMVGEQKREKHQMGVNFVCFGDKDTAINSGVHSLVNEIEEFELKDILNDDGRLQRSYRFVNPQTSFYACDRDKFYKVRDFKEEKEIFYNMESITEGDRIGFSIEGGTSCIRIFYSGKHIVDYLLSDQNGEWICHYSNDLHELLNNLPVDNRNIDKLVQRILNLSYTSKGAILVLTTSADRDCFKTAQSVNLKNKSFLEISNTQFNTFADFDGAMIIKMTNNSAFLSRCGVFLSSQGKLSNEYIDAIKRTTSGTRHEKAAMYAHDNPHDYVIIISENRSISVLKGEELIYWRDKQIKNQINK